MNTVYRLCVIGKSGMYSRGDSSASADLARQNPGSLFCDRTARLGIVARKELPGLWTDAAGNQHQRFSDEVLIEAETERVEFWPARLMPGGLSFWSCNE